MEYELTCLYGCGHTFTADPRESVGAPVMEHMDDEHDTSVNPFEADELVSGRLDDVSLRQVQQ